MGMVEERRSPPGEAAVDALAGGFSGLALLDTA